MTDNGPDGDPIVRAWSAAFPGVFTPIDQAGDELRAHFRYPENLFQTQATQFANYHVTDTEVFYQKQDFWQIPEDPTTAQEVSATTTTAVANSRIRPYYLLLKAPGDTTERFQLASDRDGLLSVESASVREHLTIDMALWLGYANDPLTISRTTPTTDRTREGSLVGNQFGGELVAAVGLFDHAQLALVVPLVLSQSDDISGSYPTMPTAPDSSFAIGDLRLVPRDPAPVAVEVPRPAEADMVV